jgi:hypothetical protein
MPSLVGTTVTANYLKTKPSTQFGTRQLSVLNIAQAGVFVDYALSNSLYSKSVRALQQTAEVWAVFTPVDAGTDSYNVIIATDTQWDGVGTGTGAVFGADPLAGDGSYTALEAAIQAGSGVACTVSVVAGCVAPFNG